MPFIRTDTNVTISDAACKSLKEQMGRAIALIPGKSESWLMLEFNGDKAMYFAGADAPLVMAEVTIFGGASDAAYDALTAKLTKIFSETLSVDPGRIYIKYAETGHWGWNGGNF